MNPQSTESVNRVSTPSQSPMSYVRTDERTDGEVTHPARTPEDFVTRTRTYGFEISLAEGIIEVADFIEGATKRTPILRVGERDPIPKWLRTAIYRRDSWTCQWCGTPIWVAGESGPLHLDHIVPWSAGGSDESTNLRTLCEHCNQDRSNFATDIYARRTPVGYCDACLKRHHERGPGEDPPIIAFCYSCRHVRPVTDRGRLW